MLTSLIEIVTGTLQKFIDSLDVDYIVCLLFLCYLTNKWIDAKSHSFLRCFRTRYRVFILGTLYGFIVFAFRGVYTVPAMESLFKSYLFAVVLYSLVLEIPLTWFEGYLRKKVKQEIAHEVDQEVKEEEMV